MPELVEEPPARGWWRTSVDARGRVVIPTGWARLANGSALMEGDYFIRPRFLASRWIPFDHQYDGRVGRQLVAIRRISVWFELERQRQQQEDFAYMVDSLGKEPPCYNPPVASYDNSKAPPGSGKSKKGHGPNTKTKKQDKPVTPEVKVCPPPQKVFLSRYGGIEKPFGWRFVQDKEPAKPEDYACGREGLWEPLPERYTGIFAEVVCRATEYFYLIRHKADTSSEVPRKKLRMFGN